MLEMFAEKEFIVFFFLVIIHQSVTQSTTIVPIKYERVSVEANSFSTSITKTTNGGVQRYRYYVYIDAHLLA